MNRPKFYHGSKSGDADKYDAWLQNHQNDELIINNFKKCGKETHPSHETMIHKASCRLMNRFQDNKYTRIKKYGKLCGSDKKALIKDYIERTDNKPPTNCSKCFKK